MALDKEELRARMRELVDKNASVSWADVGAKAVELVRKRLDEFLTSSLSHYTLAELDTIAKLSHEELFDHIQSTTPVPLADERPKAAKTRRR